MKTMYRITTKDANIPKIAVRTSAATRDNSKYVTDSSTESANEKKLRRLHTTKGTNGTLIHFVVRLSSPFFLEIGKGIMLKLRKSTYCTLKDFSHF